MRISEGTKAPGVYKDYVVTEVKLYKQSILRGFLDVGLKESNYCQLPIIGL